MKLKYALAMLSAIFLLSSCNSQASEPVSSSAAEITGKTQSVTTVTEISEDIQSTTASAETSEKIQPVTVITEISEETESVTAVTEISEELQTSITVTETTEKIQTETVTAEASEEIQSVTAVSEISAETESVTTAAETTVKIRTTASVTKASEETQSITAVTEISEETQSVTDVTEDEIPSVEIEGKTYSLVFEDNFDGDTLDETKWNRCEEWKRQDMNNYWDDDMSYLDGNGNLVIEMSYNKEEDKYLSGAVNTKGKFEQTYGYFEISCKVNEVPGYWTAFWLMGETVSNVGNGGLDGTEIDIMESAYYNDKKINHALHWDGYDVNHRSVGNSSKADIYDGKFHTYALLWTEKEYVFFIDGKKSWETNASSALGVCKVPLYMKITSEMGSWTAAQGLDPDKLPDRMLVDYVKVYSVKEK